MSGYIAHPWHGVSWGEDAPYEVNSYIEVTPSDTVKYEMDKETGILKIDRPQLYSNVCPTLYGFIPQTYCGHQVADYCRKKYRRDDITGDKDPLDICVLAEKLIPNGNILLKAIPIGGIKLIDNNEVDDKIIAVLKKDALYGELTDAKHIPQLVLRRLKHYFLTYKKSPESDENQCEILDVYDREEALAIIEYAINDYKETYIKS